MLYLLIKLLQWDNRPGDALGSSAKIEQRQLHTVYYNNTIIYADTTIEVSEYICNKDNEYLFFLSKVACELLKTCKICSGDYWSCILQAFEEVL